MAPEVITAKSTDWFEAFKQQYDLAKIPEGVRPNFIDFLLQRAAVRSLYEAIPEDQFDYRIGKGDSVRQELIHQIGHSRLRAEGLQTGRVDNWRYAEVHPQEQELLTTMSKDELIREFDNTATDLYELFTRPETQTVNVQFPFGKTVNGSRLLQEVVYHEILHEGMGIKLGDGIKIDKDQIGIPRPAPVKRVWG